MSALDLARFQLAVTILMPAFCVLLLRQPFLARLLSWPLILQAAAGPVLVAVVAIGVSISLWQRHEREPFGITLDLCALLFAGLRRSGVAAVAAVAFALRLLMQAV